MNCLEKISGSYCKIALISSNSNKGIVQTGFVKTIDVHKKILTLENANGTISFPFHQILAVKKIE
jgi:hypothetical protein